MELKIYNGDQLRDAFYKTWPQMDPQDVERDVKYLMNAGFHYYLGDRYQLLVVDGGWEPENAIQYLYHLMRG